MDDFFNEQWDIVIQGGQSNAEGHGRGPVGYELTVSDDVFYLEAEKDLCMIDGRVNVSFPDKPFVLSVAQERYVNGEFLGDFSLTFAQKYKEKYLQKGRKLLIVRAALGGTGFKERHWGLQDVLYQKMMEMAQWARVANQNNRVVAFLWHQGEGEVVSGHEPNLFEEQLQGMLAEIRRRFGDIPCIAADFVREWKEKQSENCGKIVEKIRKVFQANGAFVETADLFSNNQKIQNGDEIHFCRESLRELGYRYFDAYQLCASVKKED